MKFGIIVNNINTSVPTTANFETNILNSLNKLNKEHEIVVFSMTGFGNSAPKNYNFKFVNVNDFGFRIKHIGLRNAYKKWYSFFLRVLRQRDKAANVLHYYETSPLNKALAALKIEFAWQPFCTHPVDIPYMINCLDINYRINPFFPEERYTYKNWIDYNSLRINLYQRASYIITGTTSGKEEVVKHFNIAESKVRKVPFFAPNIEALEIANKEFNEITLTKLPEKFLFYPARMVPHKNHITILLALKLLKEKNIKIDMVFVGLDKGNLGFVQQKIKEFGLEDSVHYFGSVSFKEIDFLYRKAFALVYASMNGPDNLPPLEAFASGCPVIASLLSGTREQLGDCALLFEKLDYKALATNIETLMNDNNLRLELTRKGIERAKELTPDSYVEEILKVVNEYKEYAKLWDEPHFKHNW